MSRCYFIFDKNKCVGCEACIVACMNENGFQEPDRWRTVLSSNECRHPGLPLFYLSMSCNHCDVALCMDNCPALAYERSSETGAVLHSADKCIGCKYCIWNCPYGAPKYSPVSGVISKCDSCESRIAENRKPACASLCPTGALDFSFEEIDKSAIASTLEVPVNPRPSIVIKELHDECGPKIDRALFESVESPELQPDYGDSISALKEWPLVVFSLIASALVAFAATDLLNNQSVGVKILFLAVGIAGAALSSLHLGQKMRAWRSLLNIRKSWLSREILFLTLFLAALIVSFFIYRLPDWMIAIPGLLMLVSVDLVYRPAQHRWKTRLHSTQTLFIAFSVYLLLIDLPWRFAGVLFVRLILFALHNYSAASGSRLFNTANTARILCALLAVVFLIFGYPVWLYVVPFTLGEILDRIAFYSRLSVGGLRRLVVHGKAAA